MFQIHGSLNDQPHLIKIDVSSKPHEVWSARPVVGWADGFTWVVEPEGDLSGVRILPGESGTLYHIESNRADAEAWIARSEATDARLRSDR